MRSIVWEGDNAAEVERLLSDHLARADKHGDKLVLIGIGLNVELSLGDTVLLDGDRLGIVRAGAGIPDLYPEMVVWAGDNLPAFEEFLKPAGVHLVVQGERLSIYGGFQHIATLNRGDRVERKNGQMVVSRVGKDHRH
jgi:hypothetical protein